MEQDRGYDRLLYVNDLAARLGRSPGQINWMVHTGQAPPSAKIAGRRVFRESQVEDWINDQFEAEQEKRLSA